MSYVFKYSPSYAPKCYGTLDEFKEGTPNIEVGDEIAPGLRSLMVYPDDRTDPIHFFLADSIEIMQKYVDEVDAELFAQLNQPSDAPEDQA